MQFQSIRQDPATPLIRALLVRAGGKAELIEARSTDWASITFAGQRHAIELKWTGDTALTDSAAFAGGLDVHEFHLRGHIVADILVAERAERREGTPQVQMLIEALTLEDG